jgi:hypothetical protein
VFCGWPNNATLNTDLAAFPPVSQVSIFPMPGMTQALAKYAPTWTYQPQPAPTLTVTITGTTATFTGTPSASMVIGLVAGLTGLSPGYAYRPLVTDTLATIAAAFAALIPGATSTGPVVTLSAPSIFTLGEVYCDTVGTAEVGRQRDGFQISIWTPDDATRSAIAAALKQALCGQVSAAGFITYAITLPDSTRGILLFRRETTMDGGEIANCYRRDLVFSVEYPTILTKTFPPLLFGSISVVIASGGGFTTGAIQPAQEIITDLNGNLLTTGDGGLIISLSPAITS